MLDQAFQDYKTANADNLRDEFIPQLARARSDYFGTQYESELRQLLQTEQQRKLSRAIKRMRNKLSKPPTTQVFVTKNNQRRLVMMQEDLEQVCINENEAHFSQSSDTPFMQPPLCHDLGFLAKTTAATQILHGTYEVPNNIDKYTKK